jgi:LPXTG-motif cell wall-anchored protein
VQNVPAGIITETSTPTGELSLSVMPAPVSVDASHYYERHTTPDPYGGQTTVVTDGHGDVTTIDKDWSDGDHTHVSVNVETGVATMTETPKGGKPSEPQVVQPGGVITIGRTTLTNNSPDGGVVLTHFYPNGGRQNDSVTPTGVVSSNWVPVTVSTPSTTVEPDDTHSLPSTFGGDTEPISHSEGGQATQSQSNIGKATLNQTGTQKGTRELPSTGKTDAAGIQPQQQALPQTGDDDHSRLSLIGLGLAAMLGLFGLAGRRKRKE